MTEIEAREELDYLRKLKHRKDAKLREIDRITTAMQRVTSVSKDVQVQQSRGVVISDDYTESIERLHKAKKEAAPILQRYEDLAFEVERVLDKMKDPLLAEILFCRYVQGLSWKVICKSLRYRSERTIFRAHSSAVEDYAKLRASEMTARDSKWQ